mmetsp:Transcript_56027/g.128638  ORF Transcript_56027/g.128638 Transcript_56027/m.128638 type:complete len:210 (+) Transcript_56027:347-976(+)
MSLRRPQQENALLTLQPCVRRHLTLELFAVGGHRHEGRRDSVLKSRMAKWRRRRAAFITRRRRVQRGIVVALVASSRAKALRTKCCHKLPAVTWYPVAAAVNPSHAHDIRIPSCLDTNRLARGWSRAVTFDRSSRTDALFCPQRLVSAFRSDATIVLRGAVVAAVAVHRRLRHAAAANDAQIDTNESSDHLGQRRLIRNRLHLLSMRFL